MSISLIKLKFAKAPYTVGEEVGLIWQGKCAGCGNQLKFDWLRKLHLKRAYKYFSKWHHSNCACWLVLGITIEYTQESTREEIVLLGRPLDSKDQQTFHRGIGATFSEHWPSAGLLRKMLGADYPKDPQVSA